MKRKQKCSLLGLEPETLTKIYEIRTRILGPSPDITLLEKEMDTKSSIYKTVQRPSIEI